MQRRGVVPGPRVRDEDTSYDRVIRMASDEEVRDRLRSHVRAAFAGRDCEEVPGTDHVREAIAELAILRVRPTAPSEPWVYVSIGAWEATKDDGAGDGFEFAILSPVESRTHIDTLSTAAYFHSFYGLAPGRTLKVARGWLPDSMLDRVLVSLPTPLPPALELCDAGGRAVRFLWLRPITRDEERFSKEHGVPALERTLEERRVDPLARDRDSVV